MLTECPLQCIAFTVCVITIQIELLLHKMCTVLIIIFLHLSRRGSSRQNESSSHSAPGSPKLEVRGGACKPNPQPPASIVSAAPPVISSHTVLPEGPELRSHHEHLKWATTKQYSGDDIFENERYVVFGISLMKPCRNLVIKPEFPLAIFLTTYPFCLIIILERQQFRLSHNSQPP